MKKKKIKNFIYEYILLNMKIVVAMCINYMRDEERNKIYKKNKIKEGRDEEK